MHQKKEDLSDFECGARQAGPNISETADWLGFSHTAISIVCRELPKKDKISSEAQLTANI